MLGRLLKLFNILGWFSILQKLELEYFHNYPGDISRKQFEKFALYVNYFHVWDKQS